MWNIGGKHPLVFTAGGSTYAHTMYVTSVTPVSTTATSFTGVGTYDPNPADYTWTVSGTVNKEHVSFKILYTGKADPGYTLTATGVIAPNGSVSGTATDSNNLTLPFTMPAGSAFQVLRFQAPVTWATIGRHDATFGFTVPRMPVRLAGLHMIAKVHDGGPGFTHDTYAQGVAFWGHFGKVFPYPDHERQHLRSQVSEVARGAAPPRGGAARLSRRRAVAGPTTELADHGVWLACGLLIPR